MLKYCKTEFIKMPKSIFTSLLLLALSSAALAECEKGSTVVFSCTTAKAKVIEVCDSGKTIDYSYGGKNSQPEIVIRALRTQASTNQYSGIGRHMANSVAVPNGDTSYSVFSGIDKMFEGDKKEPKQEAGVSVTVRQKLVARVMCDTKMPITDNMEGIKLKSSD